VLVVGRSGSVERKIVEEDGVQSEEEEEEEGEASIPLVCPVRMMGLLLSLFMTDKVAQKPQGE